MQFRESIHEIERRRLDEVDIVGEQTCFVADMTNSSLHVDVVAGLAQLVRAPGCGSGGRGFDPHSSPQYFSEAIAM